MRVYKCLGKPFSILCDLGNVQQSNMGQDVEKTGFFAF